MQRELTRGDIQGNLCIRYYEIYNDLFILRSDRSPHKNVQMVLLVILAKRILLSAPCPLRKLRHAFALNINMSITWQPAVGRTRQKVIHNNGCWSPILEALDLLGARSGPATPGK